MRRLNLAMLFAGVSAFALLYATQALLPELGAEFGVGATAASLTVSVTTGALALTVLPYDVEARPLGGGCEFSSISTFIQSLYPRLLPCHPCPRRAVTDFP